MSTSTPPHALAAGGELPFGDTRFALLRLGPLGLPPETTRFVVPSGDGTIGTVGSLAMESDHVAEAADTWLEFRRELCADPTVSFLPTDLLDASKRASGRGRPRLTTRRCLSRSEKRAYRGVFRRGLDAVATMPGTTPRTAFRRNTPSAQMTELYLDRLVAAHAQAGTPAVVVVPAKVVRPSWSKANAARVEEDSALMAALFPDASPVGLLLEATQFPAYAAFLHEKQHRNASVLLSRHLPEAVPPVAL
ncbi:hypothetical protein [Streptomyces sp. NPDC048269]|uniref:hypothetical protein n=1 Tax=Streptomyces sp. NPDC048269 TaxID=3155753 RepID=UPI003418B741